MRFEITELRSALIIERIRIGGRLVLELSREPLLKVALQTCNAGKPSR